MRRFTCFVVSAAVLAAAAWWPWPQISVADASTSDAVLMAAGDIASCSSSGDTATAALLGKMSGTIVTLGDNAYQDGTLKQFKNCFGPTWGLYKSRIRPSAGNHEYITSDAAGYFGYFGSAAGDPRKGYYAFNLGAWRIYALNSNCTQVGGCSRTSPEGLWLRNDLADHPHQCVLAYWHHPRYSSGDHGNNPNYVPFWKVLYNHGAEIVLNGHDHDYERFALQDPFGNHDTANGIREFVVGTGGKSHYGFFHIKPNSQVRNSNTFGVLKLTLSAGSYAWKFVPVAGKTFTDSGTGTCH